MGLRTQPPSNTYGATQAQNQGLRTPQPRHWPGLGLTAKGYAVGRGHSSLHPPASGLRILAARDRRVCWSGGDQGRPPGGSQRKVCGSEGQAGGLAAASAPGAPWWPRGEGLDTSQRGAGRAPGCRFQRVQSVGLATGPRGAELQPQHNRVSDGAWVLTLGKVAQDPDSSEATQTALAWGPHSEPPRRVWSPCRREPSPPHAL